MSADLAFSQNPATKNPFEAARRKLVAALLAIKPPAAYPSFPSPADHEAIAAHIREAADIFDTWLLAVGFQVADNASHDIDMRCFEGAFTGAVDGNATYEIKNCAERLIEDHNEARSMRRRA